MLTGKKSDKHVCCKVLGHLLEMPGPCPLGFCIISSVLLVVLKAGIILISVLLRRKLKYKKINSFPSVTQFVSGRA